MRSIYTTHDVAEIVGVQESRLRYWAQTGFVGPSEKMGGKAAYTFQDLVSVRAAKELLDHGVSLQRARKGLEALKAQLPNLSRPLTQLKVISNGDRLVVAGDTPFEPFSGQLLLSFEVSELEGRAAEVLNLTEARPASEVTSRAETAYAWFVEGSRLDALPERTDEALIAYQKALEGDPQLAAAHTNLGAILCQRGELGEARSHYEAALAIDPDQPEARYNLGNLLDDLGEAELAVGEWLRVVSAQPEFADAHYNLGLAFTARGLSARARLHLQQYLDLDPEGEWNDRARSLLGELEGSTPSTVSPTAG